VSGLTAVAVSGGKIDVGEEMSGQRRAEGTLRRRFGCREKESLQRETQGMEGGGVGPRAVEKGGRCPGASAEGVPH